MWVGATMAVSYASIAPKFAAYHTVGGNVACHLVTLFVGYVGAGGLATRVCVAAAQGKGGGRASGARAAAAALWLAYALALGGSDVPFGLAVRSAAVLVAVAAISAREH